ncbi:hypothetical protein [Peribacillus frigoritolerans]|uniref:hypothetical protein n=1 Tax=Peribacillus frigoritolerans TaxID=450367 RepID=UPI002079282E|nr:hypothetical protein [Peribacillus frigoritolerans]USK77858.1 hypothetical protein LIT31_27070 [Peribacillus frigoritolerans]
MAGVNTSNTAAKLKAIKATVIGDGTVNTVSPSRQAEARGTRRYDGIAEKDGAGNSEGVACDNAF